MPGLIAILAASIAAAAMPAPDIGADLAALRQEARTAGETIWPGYGNAPFGLLLIDGDTETLLCQAAPDGFTAAGRDQATGCERHVRPRNGLPANLLAAMPIFGPPSTIVMGTPEATGLSPARWRSTVLHEHFHQWQAALPDYYERVAALDLAAGDETGMWMLNFPFPYHDPAVAAAYAQAAQTLSAALDARGTAGFESRLRDYVERRRVLAATAGERNWRYLEFQLWQEGVARWTEMAIGGASADMALRSDAEARRGEILEALRNPDLLAGQRLVVYALGAGEAMLLEACGPAWRARYPRLLALGPLVEEAGRSCRAA